MKKLLNKSGYTLIEIIISMSIFSVALVMITGFYINFTKFHNNIETNSIQNTHIINALNYIKYSIDETTYLQIVSKEEVEKNKNKGSDYGYIMLDNGNIVSGRLDDSDNSIILSENDLKSKINIKFKKNNQSPSDLIIELLVPEASNQLVSYINMQNMQYNNIQIQGDEGVAIIYKKE